MKSLHIAALLIAAVPTLAFAQRAPESALWFGAGAGRGFAQVDCSICTGWRDPAMTGWLRMGGRIKPRLLLGAEASAWWRSEDQVTERIFSVGVSTDYYVRRSRRLFVRGGAAVMSYRIEDNQETISASAIALQAGAGYDFPVASRFFITPTLVLSHGLFGGALKFNGAQLGEKASLTLVQLGVGVTRR